MTHKGIGTAVKYGLVFGIGVGISMGYGSYSVMPIFYSMAFNWLPGSVVEDALRIGNRSDHQEKSERYPGPGKDP